MSKSCPLYKLEKYELSFLANLIQEFQSLTQKYSLILKLKYIIKALKRIFLAHKSSCIHPRHLKSAVWFGSSVHHRINIELLPKLKWTNKDEHDGIMVHMDIMNAFSDKIPCESNMKEQQENIFANYLNPIWTHLE